METGREGLRDAEKNSHRLQAESVKELDQAEMVEKGYQVVALSHLAFDNDQGW